jgi:hypothetical protein
LACLRTFFRRWRVLGPPLARGMAPRSFSPHLGPGGGIPYVTRPRRAQ